VAILSPCVGPYRIFRRQTGIAFGIDTLLLGTVEHGDDYTDRYRSIYRSIDLSAVVPVPYSPRVPLLHISRIMQHGWLSQL
jgi:hypothetical protein